MVYDPLPSWYVKRRESSDTSKASQDSPRSGYWLWGARDRMSRGYGRDVTSLLNQNVSLCYVGVGFGGCFERKGCRMGVLKILLGCLFPEIWAGNCLGRDKKRLKIKAKSPHLTIGLGSFGGWPLWPKMSYTECLEPERQWPMAPYTNWPGSRKTALSVKFPI